MVWTSFSGIFHSVLIETVIHNDPYRVYSWFFMGHMGLSGYNSFSRLIKRALSGIISLEIYPVGTKGQ